MINIVPDEDHEGMAVIQFAGLRSDRVERVLAWYNVRHQCIVLCRVTKSLLFSCQALARYPNTSDLLRRPV
jgi:hypothetical protein